MRGHVCCVGGWKRKRASCVGLQAGWATCRAPAHHRQHACLPATSSCLLWHAPTHASHGTPHSRPHPPTRSATYTHATPPASPSPRQGGNLPDVVLVRKSYEEKRRRRRARGQQRAWKLKRMAVDAGEEEGGAAGAAQRGGRGVSAAELEQRDLERFMEVRPLHARCVRCAWCASSSGSRVAVCVCAWLCPGPAAAAQQHCTTCWAPTFQEMEGDPEMRTCPHSCTTCTS